MNQVEPEIVEECLRYSSCGQAEDYKSSKTINATYILASGWQALGSRSAALCDCTPVNLLVAESGWADSKTLSSTSYSGFTHYDLLFMICLHSHIIGREGTAVALGFIM